MTDETTNQEAASSEDFVGFLELARMRQAEVDHPATEGTNAGGWCKRCGCGNDVLGYKHLRSCPTQKAPA